MGLELDLNEVKELSLNYFDDKDKQSNFEEWFNSIQKHGKYHFVCMIAEAMVNSFNTSGELKSNVGV